MKTKSILPTLLALTLTLGACVSISGCASTPTSESTGEYIDDSVITTKVKAAFAKDKTVSAMAISVETFKGVVQLSGFVTSSEEKAAAERVARTVKGVTSVVNNITLK